MSLGCPPLLPARSPRQAREYSCPSPRGAVKLATFNVNGVNGRLSVLLRWLAEAAPDVVCLQELKTPQEKFPETAIREAGYGVVWHGQKSWNGVAILARGTDPIETRRGLPGARTVAFPAIQTAPIAATSKRPSTACWSAASICRTATRRPDRSSTTSCAGSSG
jgi:endonuclease/exonuclease/phosphatase (EEP) superfamily protein YafD